jgi:hypothetical protein
MFDPRSPSPMMQAPSFKFAGDDGISLGSAETIRLRAGLTFILTSFLLHVIRPHRGNRVRVSMAFRL